jgi:DNA mismatch repair protein MutL
VNPIVVLPADVANQIAAGEVVERPASVLKELVENALDAGARSITVTVDVGGVARIAVTDDGGGMTPEDLALSVVRHATSKIRVADDLIGVATYGFRGEALASIGSVSRTKITSRRQGEEAGAEILVEGGAPATVKPSGCAVGTTVSVEDLFYNTPARRKFLRTPQTEWAACADAVARLALPRPDVRFVLRRDGKVVREWLRQDSVAQRAREIWSDEQLAEMGGERGGVKVLALLGPPERARSGANAIALYVNGRHVRDRLLMRAVSQAYGSTLESGRYPVGAMLVEVPPEQVDVNVHPQKSEVRFATQNEVFAVIVSVLRDSLGGAPWARASASGSDFWTSRFSGGPRIEPALPSTLFEPPAAPAPAAPMQSALPLQPRLEHAPSPAPPLGAFVAPPQSPDPWGLTPQPPYPPAPYEIPAPPLPGALPPRPTNAGSGQELPGQGTFGALRYVAQLRRMFLVCEGEHGMVLLDQHAAAERVTFDRLRRAYAARTVAMQPLLVPEPVEVTARDVALVEERATELLQMGIELTPLGPTTLSVRAVPALLTRADPRRLARDILAEVSRQGNDFSRALDLVLATMACHGSVRGGDELAEEEARALLRALDEVDFAGHCPHGRPVVWSVRWSELERKLGR